MSAIINGSQEPQFNKEEIRFGQQGSEFSRRIQGPADAVKKLIPDIVSSGGSGVYICDSSPVATIEYSIGSMDAGDAGSAAAENPTTIYECASAFAEKDILYTDIAAVNGLTDDEKKLLRGRIEGTPLTTAELASLGADAQSLHADIIEGVRSVRVAVPSLKVSKVVSNRYTIPLANTNAGRVLSSAKVSSDEAFPVSALFNLPSGTTTKPNRVYGWLKHFPTINVAGSNRFSMTQEYEFGLWSTVLYGDLVT